MFTRLDFFKDCRSGGIWGSDQEGGRSGIILHPRLQFAPGPVLSSEPVELPKEWCSYRILSIIGKIYKLIQIQSVIPNPVLSEGEGLRMHGINEPVRPERIRRATLFLAARLRTLSYRLVMRVCFASLAMTSLLITSAHSDPIIKNELEDINILISQVIGGEPNVLIIWDNSLSMADNFGGTQVGSWDSGNFGNVIGSCELFQNVSTNYARAHCIGNASGTNPCGSIACTGSQIGPCERPEDFENFLQCIETKYPTLFSSVYTTVVPNACGGSTNPRTECTNITERVHAAAAIEYEALKRANAANSANFPLNCGAANCTGDTDKSCNGSTEYNTFKTCMDSLRIQPTTTTCTQGQNCGRGKFGSTRMDISLSVFFELLDADESLATKFCDDTNRLFDGVNPSISCKDYMNTPFRDVNGPGSGTSNLPITGATDTPLIDELTGNDADVLGLRFLPMTYAGSTAIGSCTSNTYYNIPSGGFAGGSKLSLEKVWKWFRGRQAGGRTPLALSLGFDDSNSPSSTVGDDALNAFRVGLQTDPAVSCRPEFVIVITDGEDTCSGDCNALPGSCSSTPAITGNANRRSSVQAVSNLRTFYSRNPVQGNFKKEIFTFVIGLGLNDPQSRRTLNAMALAGGTHTTGVIQHEGPDGITIGSVNITDVLPSGSAFQVFEDLGIAKGIDTSPSNAQLQGCKTRNENGVCTFQSTNIFDNNFFNTGAPFVSTTPFEDSNFAFFASNPEELTAALQNALQIIQEISSSTAGVSPATAQSVAQFTSRDRAILSILTPISGERIWQGRLGLYGFIDDPNNPGAKIIVDKDRQEIFGVNGALNQNAQDFFWEAGKLLTEGDPSTRRLFSVNTFDPTDPDGLDDNNLVTIPSSGEVVGIRYIGERATFDTNLPPELFGISDADVTDPIPDFCTTACDPATTCLVVTDAACITCVKDCIRDKVVNFMRGDTEIQTVADPMGLPTTGSQSVNSMGFSCPDPDAGTGSLDTCSVRLGPVFHGSPIIVGSPSTIFFDVGFQKFASAFKNRTGVVYAASNDGFIHAFNAGDFQNASPGNPIKNPFTDKDETVPFFDEGDGTELFGFAPPSFLPDAIAPTGKDPKVPPSGGAPPDYRFGDFKTFVVDNQFERSFMDGTPLIADLFIDGEENGITADSAICPGESGTDVGDPDGKIDCSGREWHTVLLAGYRNGGGAYTALDVTNVDRTQTDLKKFSSGPDYPKHLWTVFDKNFGNSWSEPTIGRVKMMTKNADGDDVIVDRWVMFVGGGLDPLDTDPRDTTPAGVNFGNAFYVIDITTGKIIFKLAKDTTSAPNATLTDSRMVCEMSSKVGAFDYNADGFIDVVFDGDTCGRLWRIDTSEEIVDNGGDITKTGLRGDADISASNWTADIAFCATANIAQCNNPSLIPLDPVTLISQRQPIFFAPTAVLDDLGRRHVIFVTGNRRHPSSAVDFGKLYNFIDNFVPSFLAGGTPISATTKTEADFTTDEIIDLVPQGGFAGQFTTSGGTDVQGEFIVRFPSNIPTPAGEKGFGSPVVINSVLVFTTFSPGAISNDPCSGGLGEGRVFALDYLTGEPALARIPGALGLIQGNASEQALSAGLTAAEGMPTPPQLTFGPSGNVVFTVAFTGSATLGGSSFLVWEFAKLPSNTSTLFWEEIF